MTDDRGNARAALVFRVRPDSDGQVYLSLEGVEGKRAAVRRPVTQETLEEARTALTETILIGLAGRGSKPATQDQSEDPVTQGQRDAGKEIDAALAPMQADNLLDRSKSWVFSTLVVVPFQLFIGLALISIAYKGVQLSSENLPAFLHLTVLAVYAVALLLGILSIATETNRQRWGAMIREWFGPRGLIIFPCLLLVTAAAVFGSFTFVLYQHDPSLLALPPGSPDTLSITEPRLLDFYMWHFQKLIPLLSINEVLKLEAPVTYEEPLIGFLILLFQGMVVIPTIATIGYYWKNRRVAQKRPYRYVSGAAPRD